MKKNLIIIDFLLLLTKKCEIDDSIKELIENDEKNDYILISEESILLLEPFLKNQLKSFKGDWKIIRISYNSGPGIARKIGMQNSDGKFIQFLDL